MTNLRITFKNFGLSELGQPMQAITFTDTPRIGGVLVIAGVHGDEIESTWLTNDLIKRVIHSDHQIFRNLSVVPCANPDGALLHQRWNARGVDLNRNLPTPNWRPIASDPRYAPGPTPSSEAETKAFLRMIDELQPNIIVSVHSFSRSLVLAPKIKSDDRFREAIKALGEGLSVTIVDSMDYEVFGSLTGFGKSRQIANVTLELLKGMRFDDILSKYSDPLYTFIKSVQERS